MIRRRFAVAICTILLGWPVCSPSEVTNPDGSSLDAVPDTQLVYVSDYFSFVGQDNHGHVAFALDNNRGRDGEAYQAEHFLALHDERKGWITMTGNGRFDDIEKELQWIPDSRYFRFHGTPRSGMLIASKSNRITLQVDAIPQRTIHRHNGAVAWMGSAPAVLTWNDRTIPGRVIYEHLMMPGLNRLARTYWDIWKEFQGIYLQADKNDDVYLHSQLSERLTPLIGKREGFAGFSGLTESMEDLQVEVLEQHWAWGFYGWPSAWRITWTGPKGKAVLTLNETTRRTIANWVIGGFSMSVVRGELQYGGKTRQVYGFAELIM